MKTPKFFKKAKSMAKELEADITGEKTNDEADVEKKEALVKIIVDNGEITSVFVQGEEVAQEDLDVEFTGDSQEETPEQPIIHEEPTTPHQAQTSSTCTDCKGTGLKDQSTLCTACNGSGEIK